MRAFYTVNHMNLEEVIEEYMKRAIVPLFERNDFPGSNHLGIAVGIKTDPTKPNQLVTLRYDRPGTDPTDQFVMYAKNKCLLSLKHNLSTREIVELMPHLLEAGDILYAGGINYRGIGVGVSGVEDYNDERFALQIAAEIWGFCKAMEQEEREQGKAYVGNAE